MTHSSHQAGGPSSLVRRLLGPAQPELTCEQCFELLDEYVELELTQASADRAIPGMRPHLEGCLACREEHESLLALVASDRQGETGQVEPQEGETHI